MLILPLSTPSSGGLPPGVTSPGDGALNYVTGALTASRPSINVAQTWNNAAVPFDADLMDITDTASAAGSTVFRRRVGGADRFMIDKAGQISFRSRFVDAGSTASAFIGVARNHTGGGLVYGFGAGGGAHVFGSSDMSGGVAVAATLPGFSGGSIILLPVFSGFGVSYSPGGAYANWVTSAAGGVVIGCDTANVANQRNGGAAQTYRLERTYTDGSNRGYTDFAQDATGGLRLNSVWTGGVAAPTNLLDVQGNGTSRFVVDAASFAGTNGIRLAQVSGTVSFLSLNNTTISFGQNAGSVPFLSIAAGGQLNFGSGREIGLRSTSSVLGLLEVNNGFEGQFRDLRLRNVITPGGTAASLVAAATAGQGARSFVTDATSSTFGTIVAGGGSNKVPVWSDGVNWLIG